MKKLKDKTRINVNDYASEILKGNRIVLSKAITLIESTNEKDQKKADQLLDTVLSKAGNSLRIGITGVPGVGKSSFINVFGTFLTNQKKKVAVLAIDPSSKRTKGSILGDKTRMEDLSLNPNAYIRPTPAGNALGGVADKTREVILLCEAAGFDVILVETVGVGQAEINVRGMVDFFLLLMLAGAGDELQGIKKGIMEMADGIVITKADGDNIKSTNQAILDYRHALHILSSSSSGWTPKVMSISSINKTGIDDVWKMITTFENTTKTSGFFKEQRTIQSVEWFEKSIDFFIKHRLLNSSKVKSKKREIEKKIISGKITPLSGARTIVDQFLS